MLLGSSDRSVFSSDTPKLYEKSIFQLKKIKIKTRKGLPISVHNSIFSGCNNSIVHQIW
jgi:hypothetical protein